FSAVFGGKLSELTFAFFNLVFKKGRELSLREIGESFIEMYREAKGIKMVEITTAIEIEEAVKQKVAAQLQNLKQLQGKQVEVRT
ncbi:F0F1 ATP synthase subunit delta, partial [Klebsiella pneumoniae]|uniref:F0F1 ATP synthase subunit delta n=1 Tax=Klebsiella pneumoniae TaxID=573 RepID=UPI003EDE9E7F